MATTERGLDDFIRQGFATADDRQIEEVRQQVLVEQEWLQGQPRYAKNRDILSAIWRGELEAVTPSENLRPVARFLQPINHLRGLHPFLRPEALSVLSVLGETWRELSSAKGVRSDAKLAVTSFVRSMEYQHRLSQDPGKLALSPHESSHPTGWAFDVDSSSYYLHPEDEAPASISRRDPRQQEKLGRALKISLGAISVPTIIANPSEFDPGAISALHQTTNLMHNAGIINKVVEFTGTEHECLHICVNPMNFPNARHGADE
jgi:hypothetical protein